MIGSALRQSIGGKARQAHHWIAEAGGLNIFE